MSLYSFTAILTCPECGEEFGGAWTADVTDLQQLDAPPVADQECPACQKVMPAVEYPGWTFFGEAG